MSNYENDTQQAEKRKTSHDAIKSKESAESGAYIVCDGATCKCNMAVNPAMTVKLMVNSQQKVYVNDTQLVATTKDTMLAGIPAPFIQCSKNGATGKPCMYSATEWKWKSQVGNEHPEINGTKILTENAVVQCNAFQGEISIVIHGQQIDVSDDAVQDIDDATAIAIVCLFEKVEEVEQNKVIPSVLSIKHKDYTSSKKQVVALSLRENLQYEFTANYTSKTEKALYSYWYIRKKREKEKNPLEFVPSEGLVYKQSGNKIALKINEAGEYYIEGFGQLKYSNGGNKKQLFTDCVFLLKVQKNKFEKIHITPSAIEQIAENTLEVYGGQTYMITIETLFELTEEEKQTLLVRIKDSQDNIIKTYSFDDEKPFSVLKGLTSFPLKTINEGAYHVFVQVLHEPERKYTFIAVKNRLKKKITANLPSSGLVRINSRVKFEAELEQPERSGVIRWYVDGKEQQTVGSTFEYTFRNEKKYQLQASLFRLFAGNSKTDTYHVDVRRNVITGITTKNAIKELPVGETVQFTALPVFEKLIQEDKEGITWKLKALKTSDGIRGRKMLESKGSQKIERYLATENVFLLGTNLNTDTNLTIKFNQTGEYELCARIGDTPFCPVVKVCVLYAHIETWQFADSKGNERCRIGWGQAFCIRLKVMGWENKKLQLQLWYDTGKTREEENGKITNIDDCLKKIDTKELAGKEYTIENDGSLNVLIDSVSFWQSFEKLLPMKSRYKAGFFFTAYDVDTVCDNWKEETFDNLENGRGHIFPKETKRTYAYIPLETHYRGMFAGEDGKLLKGIISYENTAKIVIWIENKKGEKFLDNKYRLHLIENRKKLKDQVITTTELQFENKEGRLEYDVPMDLLKESKPKEHSQHVPRHFYFILEQIFEEWYERNKEVFIYPPDYGKDSKNDDNLILFEKSDYTEEEVKRSCPPFLYKFLETSSRPSGGNVSELKLDQWKKEEDALRNQGESEKEKEEAADKSAADRMNEQADQRNEQVLKNNRNYFLQLKVAEDPNMQSSRFKKTAKKIGWPIEKEEVTRQTCVCEERIRAFLRVIRTCEGTHEENGYRKLFGHDDFTKPPHNKDMSTHPQIIIKKSGYESSAAGAYQIMGYTHKELSGYKKDTKSKKWVYHKEYDYVSKYNIPDFTEESQDKLCILILKYNYQKERYDSFYNPKYYKKVGEEKVRDTAREEKEKAKRAKFKHKNADITQLIMEEKLDHAFLISSLCWASLPDAPYGQPTKTIAKVQSYYKEYLQEELSGKSTLHLQKGFLRTLDIRCCCGASDIPLTATDIVTYHIYAEGKIIKQIPKENKYPDKRKYVYYDNFQKKYEIGIFDVILVEKVGKDTYPIADANRMVELINVKASFEQGYSSEAVKAGFKTWNSGSNRWYANPDCLAGLLGAMLDLNIDYLGFNGFSVKDGNTAGGSTSHINGVAADLRYISKNRNGERTLLQSSHFDYEQQELFQKALYKYGWGKGDKGGMCSENFNYNGKTIRLFKTAHVKKPRHNNHLHIGGFNFKGIIKQEEK